MNKFHKAFFGLEKTTNTKERSFQLLKLFSDYFPCEVIQLFRYSRLDHSFSGVLQYMPPNVKSLQHIHEYMTMNEYVHSAIKENKPTFFNDNNLQVSIGAQYIIPAVIDNLLLVPISINDVVIAYILGTNVEFEVNEKILKDADDFRVTCAEVLVHVDYKAEKNYSDKELSIMKYITFGYTTGEIARSMNFSEANVKYFIKNVMEKSGSKNRTEAVAKLFRLGVLK